jgi:hypothetical protein
MGRIDIRPPVYDTGILIPEQFGAAGNGTADDGAKLNTLFAAGNNIKLTPGKTYLTTIPLLVPYTCRSFDMTGAKIIYTVAGFGTTGTVLTFGDTSNYHSQPKIKGIWIERSGALGAWSGNDANACVRFYNTIAGMMEVQFVSGNTIGIQLCGEGQGAYYNQIHIGKTEDSQIGLDFRSNTAGVGVNQNVTFGGEFKISSSTNTSQDGNGIRYSFGSGGYETHNNNRHINFSAELSPGGAGNRTPIVMTCGQQNIFDGFRAEGYTDHIVRASGANCSRNKFDVAYYSGTLQMSDTATLESNVLTSLTYLQGLDKTPGWSSGQLVDKLKHYNSTNISVLDHALLDTSSNSYTTYSNLATASGATGITMRRDWIELGTSRGIGVFVDTNLHKNFRLWRNCIGSAGGRFFINAYDANGTVITDGTAVLNSAFSASANYGTGYRSGTDGAGSLTFRVSDATKRIRVQIQGGSAAAKVRSWGIQALGGTVEAPLTVWADPAKGGDDRLMYAATIPSTFGRYAKGDCVYNDGGSTALSTGLAGWVCTTAGAFAPAWVISTAYVAGQLVLNDTNKIYYCITAGTSAGSGGPTGNTEGTDITDNTVTWRYLCPLAVFTTMWTPTVPLVGSATWDPGNIANGAQTTTTITVTGAALGDIVLGSNSISTGGMSFTYYVSASDTVTVMAQNNSGSAVDLSSATVRAAVWPRAALGL